MNVFHRLSSAFRQQSSEQINDTETAVPGQEWIGLGSQQATSQNDIMDSRSAMDQIQLDYSFDHSTTFPIAGDKSMGVETEQHEILTEPEVEVTKDEETQQRTSQSDWNGCDNHDPFYQNVNGGSEGDEFRMDQIELAEADVMSLSDMGPPGGCLEAGEANALMGGESGEQDNLAAISANGLENFDGSMAEHSSGGLDETLKCQLPIPNVETQSNQSQGIDLDISIGSSPVSNAQQHRDEPVLESHGQDRNKTMQGLQAEPVNFEQQPHFDNIELSQNTQDTSHEIEETPVIIQDIIIRSSYELAEAYYQGEGEDPIEERQRQNKSLKYLKVFTTNTKNKIIGIRQADRFRSKIPIIPPMPTLSRTTIQLFFTFLYLLTQRDWDEYDSFFMEDKIGFFMKIEERLAYPSRIRHLTDKKVFIYKFEEVMVKFAGQHWAANYTDAVEEPVPYDDTDENHPDFEDVTIPFKDWAKREDAELIAFTELVLKKREWYATFDAKLIEAEPTTPVPVTSGRCRHLLNQTADPDKLLPSISKLRRQVDNLVRKSGEAEKAALSSQAHIMFTVQDGDMTEEDFVHTYSYAMPLDREKRAAARQAVIEANVNNQKLLEVDSDLDEGEEQEQFSPRSTTSPAKLRRKIQRLGSVLKDRMVCSAYPKPKSIGLLKREVDAMKFAKSAHRKLSKAKKAMKVKVVEYAGVGKKKELKKKDKNRWKRALEAYHDGIGEERRGGRACKMEATEKTARMLKEFGGGEEDMKGDEVGASGYDYGHEKGSGDPVEKNVEKERHTDESDAEVDANTQQDFDGRAFEEEAAFELVRGDDEQECPHPPQYGENPANYGYPQVSEFPEEQWPYGGDALSNEELQQQYKQFFNQNKEGTNTDIEQPNRLSQNTNNTQVGEEHDQQNHETSYINGGDTQDIATTREDNHSSPDSPVSNEFGDKSTISILKSDGKTQQYQYLQQPPSSSTVTTSHSSTPPKISATITSSTPKKKLILTFVNSAFKYSSPPFPILVPTLMPSYAIVTKPKAKPQKGSGSGMGKGGGGKKRKRAQEEADGDFDFDAAAFDDKRDENYVVGGREKRAKKVKGVNVKKGRGGRWKK